MNKLFKLTLAITLCLSLSSCAFYQRHKEQINGTAIVIGKRAAIIAAKVVVAAALSPRDAIEKQNYLSSLGDAFRTHQGMDTLITGSDIQSIVDLWTPDKTHWNSLGDEFARLWDQYQPKTRADVDAFLEAYAKAVQNPKVSK